MALRKGDIIDEKKNYEQSCGIVLKVTSGGAGFQNMVCCGYDLGERDLVEGYDASLQRAEGKTLKPGAVIDESLKHPNSCGLVAEVLGGGAGFKEIVCCGNVLTENDVR
jgi:hypothetical protein